MTAVLAVLAAASALAGPPTLTLDAILAQWSAECEIPVAFGVDPTADGRFGTRRSRSR
jgi:hypothetical protein